MSSQQEGNGLEGAIKVGITAAVLLVGVMFCGGLLRACVGF